MTNIIAFVQARVASSRLPNKVLLDIYGQPMLVRVVERVKRAKRVDRVIVATTTDPSDNPVEDLCAARGYACYRGSSYDVLDRYYQAAKTNAADVVVRVTADCPLIDPHEIDKTVNALFDAQVDFAANRLPPPWKRTYPIGLDTEVCIFHALERAWQEAKRPEHREHVMPYLYTEKDRFRVKILNHEPDYGHLRWTVDTQADLDVVRKVYAYFGGEDDFSWLDVIDMFERHPDLAMINAGVNHKTVFDVDERQSVSAKGDS